MSKLDDLIPLSETVLWRWPDGRRIRKGYLLWAATVPVIAAAWYYDLPGWALLWIMTIPIAMEVLRLFNLRRRITAIAITPQWIVICRGLFPKRAERIEKHEFGRATLWEHRRQLNLHRTGRETLLVEGISRSEGLMEALGLPTRVWPKRKAHGAGRSILQLSVGLMFALWIAGMAGLPLLMAFYGEAIFEWLPDGGRAVSVVFWAVVGFLVFAGLIAGAFGVIMARLAGGDALAQFIHAAGDPAWSGRKEEPGLTFRYLNAVARLTGAASVRPDTVEPKIINGPLPTSSEGAP